jgi:hypothetical protein
MVKKGRRPEKKGSNELETEEIFCSGEKIQWIGTKLLREFKVEKIDKIRHSLNRLNAFDRWLIR